MKLSANFSLNEMTKSQTATRKGIDNTPNSEHLENLKHLCEKINKQIIFVPPMMSLALADPGFIPFLMKFHKPCHHHVSSPCNHHAITM